MFNSFHQYWKSRKPMLDEALQAQISRMFPRPAMIDLRNLRPALDGGKRVRGILLGMIGELLGGEWDAALPRAVAVELIQTATLIHDDFVDQDRTRRSRPALWTLEGARRAVLLGDVIFASAIHMMSEIGPEDGPVAARAIAAISRGALMEPDDPLGFAEAMEAGRLNQGLYEKIIHLKTGVLFEAACELGAISAAADAGVRKRCRRYGAGIGQAYQIADDIAEIEKHLANGCIRAEEMAHVAPAILCFVEEARPHLASVLKGGGPAILRPLQRVLRCTAERMKQDIGRRLNLAIETMLEVLKGKPHGALGLSAPEDLLAMFALSSSIS